MQVHKLLKGKHCPRCNMKFEECLWEGPSEPPDVETIEDPGFTLLVVCVQCATILCLIVSTGELHVFNAAQIEQLQCPPEILDGVRRRQRQIYVLKARQVARRN